MVSHQDSQAFVRNKPPGLATQGGTKTSQLVDGLLFALQYDLEGRPILVHRLDMDTSGALLVARTSRAAAFFAKTFSGRTAKKVYWALVVGVPSIEDGIVDLPLAKQPGTGGEKMHVDEAEGSPARSRYRVIERAGNRAAWVELPQHFAESLAGRGFDSMLGNMMPLDTPPPPTKAEQKAKAKAHAKSVRHDRTGERRHRGSSAPPRTGGPARGPRPSSKKR